MIIRLDFEPSPITNRMTNSNKLPIPNHPIDKNIKDNINIIPLNLI